MVGIVLDVVVQVIMVVRQVVQQVVLMAEAEQGLALEIVVIMQGTAGVIAFVNTMVTAVQTILMNAGKVTMLKIMMVKLMIVQL